MVTEKKMRTKPRELNPRKTNDANGNTLPPPTSWCPGSPWAAAPRLWHCGLWDKPGSPPDSSRWGCMRSRRGIDTVTALLTSTENTPEYQHWFQHSPTPATGMTFNCSPTQHCMDTQITRISYCVGKEMLGDRKRILSIRLIIPTDFWDETASFKLQLSCLLKYAINLYASHNLF